MRRQPHLARIQVIAPRQHHAVQPIEDRREVRLARQRWDDDRQGVGGQEAIEIAAVDEAVRGPTLGRGTIVRVDPDEWTILHGSHPFLEMVSSKSVRGTPTPPPGSPRVAPRPGRTSSVDRPISRPVRPDSSSLDVPSLHPPVRGRAAPGILLVWDVTQVGKANPTDPSIAPAGVGEVGRVYR